MSWRKPTVTGILAILAACGEQGPSQSGARAGASQEAMSHDLGPFFRAETAMYDNMRSAIGTSSGDNWVRMMIAHHEGGAAMSRIVLAQETSPHIADLAARTVKAQERAAARLESLRREGPVDIESAFIFLEPIQAMHDASMAIQGSDAAKVWLSKMLVHHRGAIEMSNVLLRQNGIPEATARAVRQLRREQRQAMRLLEKALANYGS